MKDCADWPGQAGAGDKPSQLARAAASPIAGCRGLRAGEGQQAAWGVQPWTRCEFLVPLAPPLCCAQCIL